MKEKELLQDEDIQNIETLFNQKSIKRLEDYDSSSEDEADITQKKIKLNNENRDKVEDK